MSASLDSSIVLDLGNSTIKAGYLFGFPSDDEPRVVTPAAVRLLTDGDRAQTATPPSTDGHSSRQPVALVHPMQQGVVQDWDAMETLLHYVLYDELGWVSGEEGNLLLADPVATSRPDRERMAGLMFETFNAASYFVSDQAVLSLYAVGKMSGTVVDIGTQTIDVAPVLDGLVQLSTHHRLPYGGQHLTRHLAKLLAARGVVLPGGEAAAEAIAEAVKLKAMRAANPPSGGGGEEGQPDSEESATHTLPDGQTFSVETQEGEALVEALLDPSLLGLHLAPLAEVVVTAGSAHAEKETRKALLENIFVCGGGAGAGRGVSQRLLAEVRALAPPPLQPGLCSVPEYMPEHTARVAAWMGGALLAKVVFGSGQAITKADYDEIGPLIVHKKCS